jgi:hypothetical protein
MVGHANVSTTRHYDRRRSKPEDSLTFHVKYLAELKRETTLDRSIYEYSDLTDAEILERENELADERAKETAKEGKRMAKATNFLFAAGCCSSSR